MFDIKCQLMKTLFNLMQLYKFIQFHLSLTSFQNSVIDQLKQYTLPNGSIIELGIENFQAPVLLFKPDLSGSSQDGIVSLVQKIIKEANMAIQDKLVRNIILL